MQIQRPHIHLTVAAIVEDKGKFLLVEEHDKNASHYPDDKQTVLNQPAGHVELNENIIDAVIRETLEETAWHFTPKVVTGIYRWQHPDGALYVRHCFYGEVSQHDKTRTLDEGIVSTTWLTLADIKQQSPRHRSPLVLRCIEDYLSGQYYPLSIYHDLSS